MTIISSYSGDISTSLGDYQSRGKKEGGKLRPPSDATELDGNEAELLGRAKQRVADENHLFDQEVIDASRTAADSSSKLTDYTNKARELLLDESLEGQLEARLASERQGLVRLTEDRLRIQAEYNWYRSENGIMEEAAYPESFYHHFGLVAVFFMGEALLNAAFYKNQGGLLGGLMVAVVISLLNVGMAVALGWSHRYKNLKAAPSKVIGWLALVCFVIFALFFAALFSAFRSEYQLLSDPGDSQQLIAAFGRAWPLASALFTFELRFMDLYSFLLFFGNLLISAFSFRKGYTSDDKHPGYSEKDRVVKSANQAQGTAERALRESITALLEKAKSEVDLTIQEPSRLLAALSGREATLKQVRNDTLTRIGRINHDFKLVLEGYRHANVAIRTVPPPEYFQRIPELHPASPPDVLDSIRADLARIAEGTREAQTALQLSLTEKRRFVQSFTSTILNNRLPAFLAEIQSEAQSNIAHSTPAIHRQLKGVA